MSKMKGKKKIFVICPVKELEQREDKIIKAHIAKLEKAGHTVHYPPRDTYQKDVEINICRENREALLNADEVHIYYTPKSQGSKFDLGMTFISGKKLFLINRNEIARTPEKSFDNFVLQLAEWS